jgi:hypothetical protein
MAAREIPFTDQSMRKFSSIKEAFKTFELSVPKRRIVALFQSANSVKFGSVSVNALWFSNLDAETKKKFAESLSKGNSKKAKEWEAAYVSWRDKYNVKTPVRKSANTVTKEESV